MKQTFAHQARLEMQHQDEDTQWGMQLADAVSDLSTNICEDAEKIASMVAHYAAVLHGRRIGVEYQDEFGESIVIKKRQRITETFGRGSHTLCCWFCVLPSNEKNKPLC